MKDCVTEDNIIKADTLIKRVHLYERVCRIIHATDTDVTTKETLYINFVRDFDDLCELEDYFDDSCGKGSDVVEGYMAIAISDGDFEIVVGRVCMDLSSNATDKVWQEIVIETVLK